MHVQLLSAFIVSSIIVLLARWRKWLSPSGAAAALGVGVLVLGLAGWLWGSLLGVFFVSSSVLSKFRDREKEEISAEIFQKSSQRDHGQVLANGGVGALLALLSFLFPNPIWFPLYLGVLATVTADTWATELGTLGGQPRLITTGRPVQVGTSGGISPLGTLATFGGALLIGGITGFWLHENSLGITLIAGVSGLAGSLFDSLLGATVQQIYWDETAQAETEKAVKENRPMQPLRGWSWMTNDVVNLIASLVGGLTALTLSTLL